MGTRNLTCVFKDGEYKVAKYCQWDGYPSGQGQSIIDFLVDTYKPKKFAKRVDQIVEVSNEEVKERWKACGADDSGFVTMDIEQAFQVANSHLDRNLGGGKLLEYIQGTKNPEMGERYLEFAADSLFCEWCYVLDLDREQLEIYRGFNKEPLSFSERFFFLQDKIDSEYFPVKFLVAFKLNKKLEKKWNKWFEKYQQSEEE